jgi:cardiolipin synthase A/B
MGEIQHFPSPTCVVDDHQLTLLVRGADRLAGLLDVINGASVSLRLYFYIFADDAAGRQVKAALIAARVRGVSVSVLVDGFGTQDQPDSVFRPLVEVGCRFGRFLPGWGKQYLLRNHQKMLIADDRVTLTGGSNIASIYFADDPDGGSWHDLYVKIEGPMAANLACYYDALALWMETPRQKLRDLRLILAVHSKGTAHLRWLHGGPFRRLSPLTHMLRREIETAKQIDMIQAYFAPNWGMLRKLGRLARRGQFRLITAARTDSATTVNAARHCYRRLLRNGAIIYEYLPQMLHMKLIIADDRVYIGSANFDMRSLYLNGEVLLRIDDATFAAQMRDFVAAHIPASAPITKETHQAQSGWLNRIRWLSAYFIVAILDYRLTKRFSLTGE